jgi:hypothetical protein
MSSTLLLLAEAAFVLLCLFVYVRARQVLQEIRHERLAWEGMSELVNELAALMEVLGQVPSRMEEGLGDMWLYAMGSQPVEGEASPSVGTDDCLEDAYSGWHELTSADATPKVSDEQDANGKTARESGINPLSSAWGIPQKYELVLHLAEEGWSSLEIAQHTHMGREEVQMILNLWQRGQGN